MKISNELTKGSTSILILTLLQQQDMYGYQIIQEIKKRSKGVFEFKEGTLYPMLHSLANKSAIEAYWFDTEDGRRRKYYKITDIGSELLSHKQFEWKIFSEAMTNVMEEKCYE